MKSGHSLWWLTRHRWSFILMPDLCLKPSKDNLHFNIANYVKAHVGLPVTQLIEKCWNCCLLFYHCWKTAFSCNAQSQVRQACAEWPTMLCGKSAKKIQLKYRAIFEITGVGNLKSINSYIEKINWPRSWE